MAYDTTGYKVGTGSKAITAAGTAERISSTHINFKSCTLQAKFANTDNLYIGGPDVASTEGITLIPGASITISNSDLYYIYADSAVNGEGLIFTYFN